MKKILVIDDVAESREIFTTLLEEHYEVFEASDGLEGLIVAETEQPDLIFLDYDVSSAPGEFRFSCSQAVFNTLKFCQPVQYRSHLSSLAPTLKLFNPLLCPSLFQSAIKIFADFAVGRNFY